MTPTTRRTTDHERIRRWAEERGGAPVSVADPAATGVATLTLRIQFGAQAQAQAQAQDGAEASSISWDEFFERFEQARLAFLFREQAAAGGISRFCLLVERREV